MRDVGLWHVAQGRQPTRLIPQVLPTEKDLEEWIANDPSLVSPGLHPVRRQVPLGRKFMDLLAVEAPGVWVVCELKKIALERESLAPAIDYVARLEELSRIEWEAVVRGGGLEQTPQARALIQQALGREDSGEGREVRIVLAGVGVSDELTRMVGYLSRRYAVPVRVCTLSAVATHDGDGIILMRDISQDADESDTVDAAGSSPQDRLAAVRTHFASSHLESLFDAALEVFGGNPNLYVRPWKKSIMVAPAAHHGRYLAYLAPRNGALFASFGAEAIEEFFPSADLELLESLGQKERFTSVEQVRAWAQALSDAIGVDATTPPTTPLEPWNERDWFVSFGVEPGVRSWGDAVAHGFVSAGGGDCTAGHCATSPSVHESSSVFLSKATWGLASPRDRRYRSRTPRLRRSRISMRDTRMPTVNWNGSSPSPGSIHELLTMPSTRLDCSPTRTALAGCVTRRLLPCLRSDSESRPVPRRFGVLDLRVGGRG